MALREARCDNMLCDRWDQSSHVAEAQKPEFQNVIYKVATLLVPTYYISTAVKET